MSIRTILLAGVLGVPLVTGAALAAGTGDLSLANAAKQGDRSAVQSLLNGPAKQNVAGAEGAAALIQAASRNDVEIADLLLRAGADPKAANEYGATALYAAANHADPAMEQRTVAPAYLCSGETPRAATPRFSRVSI
jgi:ankyrin repeat protein